MPNMPNMPRTKRYRKPRQARRDNPVANSGRLAALQSPSSIQEVEIPINEDTSRTLGLPKNPPIAFVYFMNYHRDRLESDLQSHVQHYHMMLQNPNYYEREEIDKQRHYLIVLQRQCRDVQWWLGSFNVFRNNAVRQFDPPLNEKAIESLFFQDPVVEDMLRADGYDGVLLTLRMRFYPEMPFWRDQDWRDESLMVYHANE